MPATDVNAKTLMTRIIDLCQKIDQINDHNAAGNATHPLDKKALDQAKQELSNPQKTMALRDGINTLLGAMARSDNDPPPFDERLMLIQQHYQEYCKLLTLRGMVHSSQDSDCQWLNIVLNKLTCSNLSKIILGLFEGIKSLTSYYRLNTWEYASDQNDLMMAYQAVLRALQPFNAKGTHKYPLTKQSRKACIQLICRYFEPISTDLVGFLIDSIERHLSNNLTQQSDYSLYDCLFLFDPAHDTGVSKSPPNNPTYDNNSDHTLKDELRLQGMLGDGKDVLTRLKEFLNYFGHSMEITSDTLSGIIINSLNSGANTTKSNSINLDNFKSLYKRACLDMCPNDSVKQAVRKEITRYFDVHRIDENLKKALLGHSKTKSLKIHRAKLPQQNHQAELPQPSFTEVASDDLGRLCKEARIYY